MTKLPFELTGQVVPGKQLGSRLGFPTANIAYDPDSREWPAEGVYAAVAHVSGDDKCYLAILNQGRHPTAPGGMPTVEAHLLGYPQQAMYGMHITLTYRAFLRSEQTFPSLDALRAQLALDRESALNWARENEPQLTEGVCHIHGTEEL